MTPNAPPSVPPERWQRMKQVFTDALDLPAEEREPYVASVCGDDPRMAREVREMLRAFAIEDDFIERPAAGELGWASASGGTDWVGRRIGPYRVVAEAGRGGLGRVFRAVRDDGEVDQQVAIKVLHPGFGTPALLARFRVERRILARLNHPHIAHFLDGGATEDGAPWLAMEYVEGEPIDEYCEKHELGLEARLQLFRDLCSAVHHVHQNLLVHGDIKGGNVLVTSAGQVKLLDFGIARLLDPMAGDTGRPATLLMMTPEYASPEQRRGESITTASDVYSLGALLYVLLAGATVKKANPAASSGDVSIQPTLPSVAAARSEKAPAAFARELRGDLDTIAIKALKPEPHERYGSAEQLADDIQRYLRGFPIEARPDSTSYRIRKFAQRNSAAAAATVVALIAMVGGTAVALWQAHEARVERERAERHFETVRKLSASFLGDVYDAVVKIPGTTEARKLLVDNTFEYLKALERDAPDSIPLRRDLGVAWERLGDVQGAYLQPSLGEFNHAIDSYRRSLAVREALVRDDPTLENRNDLLNIQVVLGEILLSEDEDEEALHILSESIQNAEKIVAATPAGPKWRRAGAAYMNHGWAETSNHDAKAALKSLQRSSEIFEAILATDPGDKTARRDVALVAGRIAQAYWTGLGDRERALKYYGRTYELLAELAQEVPDNAEIQRMRVYTSVTIGQLHLESQRPREGLAAIEPELPLLDEWRKADPKDVIAPLALGAALSLAGECHVLLGEFDQALAIYAEASKYLKPELADATADIRVVYGRMAAGKARAETGLALARTGTERSAMLAAARTKAQHAIKVLESIKDDGDSGREATLVLEAVRPVLTAS